MYTQNINKLMETELTYDILEPSELPELPGFKLDP